MLYTYFERGTNACATEMSSKVSRKFPEIVTFPKSKPFNQKSLEIPGGKSNVSEIPRKTFFENLGIAHMVFLSSRVR